MKNWDPDLTGEQTLVDRPSRVVAPVTSRDEPSVAELIDRLVEISPRFEIQGEIARGAMGRILAAWDLHLGRSVAIKLLRRSAPRDLDLVRFLEEAQVTGQLQHPSIMPVYELGRLGDEVAFVMRRVEGRSLKAVIAALQRDVEEARRQFSRMRLLGVFHQLCLAVALAHKRGVVHRDLKPSNVMVGDFGEVILLDWGLCKIVGGQTRSTRSTSDRWRTVHGQIIGTPAYMAPEQAMGQIDQVDERTDVYGLGAILYHLLTLQPPFAGRTNREIVRRVLSETVIPLTTRAPDRGIPAALEKICMRCLERDQADRYNNGREVADAVEAYLEEPAQQPESRNVDGLVRQGMAAVSRRQSLFEDAALARDELQTVMAEVAPDDPPSVKKAAWEAESRLERLEHEIGEAFAEAIAALTQAAALAPDRAEAARQLCDLYYVRHERAANRGDNTGAAYYRRMVAEYDDGRFATFLAKTGNLHIEVDPLDANVWLWHFAEQDRRMVASSPRDLQRPPIKLDRFLGGVFQITAKSPGYEILTTTVVVTAGQSTRVRLRMLPEGKLPPGFVHIPAGTFRYGADAGPLSMHSEQALPDYLVSKTSVTVRAYLAYIRALTKRSPEEARNRVPRTHDGRRPLWATDDAGVYQLPGPEHESGEWVPEMPVVGISALDAAAYCQWLSEVEGVRIRLPSEEEWEKAARGTEGRRFPWGNHWEATYTAGPETTDETWPPPVGSVPADCSVFGTYDMAGGTREWTSTVDPAGAARVVVRGGSFLYGGEGSRPLWVRDLVPANRTAPDIGFRLARDVIF